MYVMASVATVSQAHSITGNIGHPLLVCVCVCACPLAEMLDGEKKKNLFSIEQFTSPLRKICVDVVQLMLQDKRGEKTFHAGRSQLVHVSQSKSLMMNQVMKLQQAGYLTLTS